MSADKMPPLPVVAWMTRGTVDGKKTFPLGDATTNLDYVRAWSMYRWVPLVTEADARAYAAEQTRELAGSVDALSFVIRALSDGIGFDMETTEFRFKADGNELGKTSISDILRRADALIAKHKGAA